MNPLSNLLRIVAVAILALAGFVMAAVLLVTSIVALGVLYLVSRVRGRPMTFGSFRHSRQAAWSFMNARSGFPGTETGPSRPARTSASGSAANASGNGYRPRRSAGTQQVIDVEVRDLP